MTEGNDMWVIFILILLGVLLSARVFPKMISRLSGIISGNGSDVTEQKRSADMHFEMLRLIDKKCNSFLEEMSRLREFNYHSTREIKIELYNLIDRHESLEKRVCEELAVLAKKLAANAGKNIDLSAPPPTPINRQTPRVELGDKTDTRWNEQARRKSKDCSPTTNGIAVNSLTANTKSSSDAYCPQSDFQEARTLSKATNGLVNRPKVEAISQNGNCSGSLSAAANTLFEEYRLIIENHHEDIDRWMEKESAYWVQLVQGNSSFKRSLKSPEGPHVFGCFPKRVVNGKKFALLFPGKYWVIASSAKSREESIIQTVKAVMDIKKVNDKTIGLNMENPVIGQIVDEQNILTFESSDSRGLFVLGQKHLN